MFIADTCLNIREDENHRIEEGMIEKLDAMLTEYGVEHFFTLPIDSTDGIANDDSHVLTVFYDKSKDEMTFDLVYALWSKVVRHADDDKLRAALAKRLG